MTENSHWYWTKEPLGSYQIVRNKSIAASISFAKTVRPREAERLLREWVRTLNGTQGREAAWADDIPGKEILDVPADTDA